MMAVGGFVCVLPTRCGRYWDRTSDLCRVKAVRADSLTCDDAGIGRLTSLFGFSVSITRSQSFSLSRGLAAAWVRAPWRALVHV